jgi:DNA modification methylase
MSYKPMSPSQGFDLDNPNQLELQDGPVECLGKTFANDQVRRDYYLAILAEKLEDPEFRKTEGFPIGEDKDILNLSDPPYYTACPNPFVDEFMAHYGRPYDPKEKYKREPYTADVSEGKNDPIYNAHSYHTKVPHKAIMRYILHYTEPGDIVFDGFCGTGMTGVAAQMCGDTETIASLGYKLLPDGTVLQEEKSATGKSTWGRFSKAGARRAVLNDLSSLATFVSHNYNSKLKYSFEKSSLKALDTLKNMFSWMYETAHTDGRNGSINYVVWSDVFNCHQCGNEVIFWDSALDHSIGKVKNSFGCPSCNAELNKKNMDRVWESIYDEPLGKIINRAKQVPVLINYSVDGHRGRFEKRPDEADLNKLNEIKQVNISSWYPIDELPDGYNTEQPKKSHGTTHSHHFYTYRNLIILSKYRSLIENDINFHSLLFAFTSAHQYVNRLCRLHVGNHFNKKGGTVDKPLEGTLYLPSISLEVNPISRIKLRSRLRKSLLQEDKNIVSTGNCAKSDLSDNSLDYIFLDPPFGANINYSEVNFLWESWLKIKTNIKKEAIVNASQNKSENDYRKLMCECFSEAYRMLKPGRWMTVEFSNTKASIWNSIQLALNEAGFIVANVSALSKKKGSHKAVTTPTAVKQDLIISAYKPNGGFEERFVSESEEEGIWDFVRTHLGYLPIVKKEEGDLIKVPERDPRILFDEVIGYFVRNQRDVPLSSKEFQDGLLERFAERDGMIFLPEQIVHYDKARMTSSQLRQLTIFVDDEASAIEWLRQQLNDKPQTYQDIHPKFINELSGWKKAEMQLELSTLLKENFLKFEGKSQVPSQIHSYLSTNFKDMRSLEKDDPQLMNKAKDRWFVPDPNNEEQVQQLRERTLLKQFEEYKNHTGKKIKLVRMEAVRAGFKKAFQDKEYEVIIHVAEKIPEALLQEDQKLLMWYDQAQTRSSEENLF